MRAIGLIFSCFALPAVISTIAAAPSLRPEELPAVTVPLFRNAGLSAASASSVSPLRGCSSVVNSTVSPFLPFNGTGMISSLNLPPSMAATALEWLSNATWSWSSLEMPCRSARFSAVWPMMYASPRSWLPEWSSSHMESVISPCCSRAPQRAFLTRYGALLIDSTPPARTMSESPSSNCCEPKITACMPEAHWR